MRTEDFDYELPVRFIAQRPARPRDSSRLLVLDRRSPTLRHAAFRDLPRFLHPNDLLVLNETRVFPARLFARKAPGGGRVELLLLRRLEPQLWEVMVGGRGVRPGVRLKVEGGPEAEVEADLGGSTRRIRFATPITPAIEAAGRMPLPPYITEPLQSPEEYQTVFARTTGSAAAPTAGLHFTAELLEALQAAGTRLAFVTLHVGLDTFAPVKVSDPREHPIHREWCRLDVGTAAAIREARAQGGRVIAVGTTSVRTLETAARLTQAAGEVEAFEGWSDLLILPGHVFRCVDAMITNFHLPRSSLLMLVSAFVGRDRILAAYESAKDEGYRFYSFGDAMLIE